MNLNALFPDIFLKKIGIFSIKELLEKKFEINGTISFADISGFTQITENLMKMGIEGSEILNKTLNFYYENIIKIIKNYNGDILGFAGDALNAFFEKEEEAINSSIEIQEFFKKNSRAETPIGIFDISIKIGIASGILRFCFLKEGDFANLLFEGEPINKAAEAEHHCSKGEIILFENNEFIKISEKKEIIIKEKIEKIDVSERLVELLHPFFKEAFLKEKERFLSEHRNCAILFINLFGADIKEIYKKTAFLLKKYDGYFLKVDCGDKGDKFLILFGLPFQVEEPVHKAFDFILDFKNLSEVEKFNFKAGINYAKIYACFLGSNERMEWNILGDGVNLSARLMQMAEEGEILTLKEVAEKEEGFSFSQKPPVQFKGKEGFFITQALSGRKTFKPSIPFFYGRKNELDLFNENFEKNKFFLVYGGQGTGKTYFTTYFIDNYAKKPLIYVNCNFSEKEISYSILKKFLKIYFEYKKKNLKNIFINQITEKYLPIFLNIFFDENLKEIKIEPEIKKGLIFNYVSKILREEFEKDEIIFFIDNGHNIDFLSFEFLKNFYKIYEGLNFKTIINLRNYEEGFDFSIEIKNFEKEDLKNFLKKFLKVSDVPKDFFEKIYKYTKGNPLILKETLNNCFLNGYISIDEEYPDVLKVNPLKEPVFSDNLENLIFLKMEKYKFEEKNFLKILSIYGQRVDLKIFDYLKDYIKFSENLKEFIYFDEKNEIISFLDENYQKIIYNSIEFDFKRNENLKIGDFLNEKLKEKEEKSYLLAYHYSEAEDKKALPFLSEISKKKEELFDIKGSIFYLEKFLKISEKNNLFFEDEILRLSNLYLLSGFPEKGIKILSENENNIKNKFLLYMNLSNLYKSIGEFVRAIELLNKSKENKKNNHQLFLSRVQEGRILGQMGRFKEAKKIIEENYKRFSSFKKEKEYYINLMNLAFFKVQSKKTKEAIIILNNSIRFFNKNKYLKELITCYGNISSIYANFFGDYEKALKYSKKAYYLSLKYGYFEMEALIKLAHNIALWYLSLGKFKIAKEYLNRAISKGKEFKSDYLYKCFCTRANLNLFLGDFIKFKEDLENAEKIGKKLNLNTEELHPLKSYYFLLKKDKKSYYRNLKGHIELIEKEKMEYLKPEILNFKAEGSLLFGRPKDYYKKEIENFNFCIKIKNYYEAYRALRFLYLYKNDEKYFKKLKKFQKKLKDKKFQVEFYLFSYLRKLEKKNKEILLKFLKKYPYFDIRLRTYEAFSKFEKDEKIKIFYFKKYLKLKDSII